MPGRLALQGDDVVLIHAPQTPTARRRGPAAPETGTAHTTYPRESEGTPIMEPADTPDQQPTDEAKQTPEQRPADKQPEPKGETPKDDGSAEGAGGKNALLADLAGERDRRQALEAQFAQLRDGLSKALGIDEKKAATPEQLAEQLAAAQTQITDRDRRLALYENAPADVDIRRLLDSRSFERALAAVDIADPAAIKAAADDFLTTHPDYRTRSGSGGDLHQGHGPATTNVSPGVPRLAAAFAQQTRR